METAKKLSQRKLSKIDESKKTLLEAFEKHNAQVHQLIDKRFVEKTVQQHETTKCYLAEFIKREYNILDIALNNLEPRSISQFDIF